MVNQRTQNFCGFRSAILIIQRFGKTRDLFPVDLTHIGMDQNRLFFGVVEQAFQFLLPPVEFPHPVLDAFSRYAVADRIDELFMFFLDAGKFGPGRFDRGILRHPQLIQVTGILFGEYLAEFRFHQLVLQTIQNQVFQVGAFDRPAVVASAFVARRRTTHVGLRDDREATAAMAALDEAGQQVFGAAAVPHAVAGFAADFERTLAILDLVPQGLIDDPEFRHVLDDPFAFGIESGNALARVRGLHITQPVPDEPSDIELIVQDAGAALAVAVDRALPPALARRTGNAILVEFCGDLLRRQAICIVIENAAHDCGFGLIDFAVAADGLAGRVETFDDIVAKGIAATGLAGFHASPQTTAGLVGKVFQEQCVHRALEADVKITDHALSKGDDLHTGKGQPLIDACNVFLIARQTVERFGDDDLKLTGQRISKKHLDTGTHHRRAGSAVVCVAVKHRPAFLVCTFLTDADLVFDRGVALHVG